MPGMQGQQKYTMFATAHGQAGMQYRARSSALRSSGDTAGANKHARLGRLHDAACAALTKIAKAHAKEFEKGRQATMMASSMMDKGKMTDKKSVKEEVEVTDTINEAFDSLIQSVIDRKPTDFAETMADLIQKRVAEKVADLKVDVAKQTFAVEEDFVDEGKTFRHDEDEGEEKKEKFSKRRKERHKREVEVDEEVEQIDEISAEKAKAYIGKAEGDYARTQHKITKGNADKSDIKRSKKRFQGIERASFKVNEETGVLTIDFDAPLTEEQMQDLEELFGKGKLDGIIKHHEKMSAKHADSAAEYKGDLDTFDHHFSKHIKHDEKSVRGKTLRHVRDTADAVRNHNKAKAEAKAMNPRNGRNAGKK